MNRKTLNFIVVTFFLMIFFAVPAFADTANGQVSVNNVAPTVSGVTLFNSVDADAAINLAAGATVLVRVNGTINDDNGGTDITSATGTLFHSTSATGDPDDENIHYSNASCTLGAPAGNTRVATCRFVMNYMALDGTWTARIVGIDAGALNGAGTDTNTVNTLAALDVINASINFGSMALNATTSNALGMSIRNLGNIQIDSQFSGTGFTCGTGTMAAGALKYDTIQGAYASLASVLSGSPTTQTTFNLGVRGVATANGANSDKYEFWGIGLPPNGAGGSCSNTITISAIAG